MNRKVKIEELCQQEAGSLTGGFVTLDAPEDSEALLNGNCSNTSGLLNGNCGCGACGPSKKIDNVA